MAFSYGNSRKLIQSPTYCSFSDFLPEELVTLTSLNTGHCLVHSPNLTKLPPIYFKAFTIICCQCLTCTSTSGTAITSDIFPSPSAGFCVQAGAATRRGWWKPRLSVKKWHQLQRWSLKSDPHLHVFQEKIELIWQFKRQWDYFFFRKGIGNKMNTVINKTEHNYPDSPSSEETHSLVYFSTKPYECFLKEKYKEI